MGHRAVSLYPTGEQPFYAFVCPTCGESVEKPADDRIIGLLKSADVRIVEDPVYPEVIDKPNAPPITLDEIIDFHFWLEAAP
jgi:hypothetical protein